MSTASLTKFLTRLVKELEGDSKDFRRKIANFDEHSITVSSGRLVTQTLDELSNYYVDLTKEEEEIILKEARIAFREMSASIRETLTLFQEKYGLVDHPQTKFSKYSLRAVFQVPEGHRINIFNLVGKSYNTQLTHFYDKIRLLVGGGKIPVAVGDFYHKGHEKKSGVVEQRVSRATAKSFKHIKNDPDVRDFVTKSRTRLAVKLRALMATKEGTLNIFIEGATKNQADGGRNTLRKEHVRSAALKAIDQLSSGKGFGNFKGSDTPLEAKRKVTIDKTLAPFKKIKGAKVTSENTKINESKGKVDLKVETKVRGHKFNLPQPRMKGGRFGKKAEFDPIRLKALINAALPGVVASHMDPPALQYRTGRFAAGTRVESVVPTRGPLAIQYSYQKYPYQTFEPGYAQGSVQRDPRKLIEGSIREIAAKLIYGQYNLERV